MDYECFSKQNKLIAIDLSKKTEIENLILKQQINSVGRLDEDMLQCSLSSKNKKKQLFNFHKML